ncbi:DUF4351 domain-containing protein [Anabaena sp. PCC 7938]|uniref:DUF4351 domain-containing protein n=1 Tax=Anabaena cylindrica (strain ATCC 27899 / PCC 7122) TaxID=272123 RepID=K9ZJX3_ANACC|nr:MULTISPECIES: DUF4351 domain-containing protein [Anabaena]AFZ58837.1 hypothetical protein Anacy_3437 [Anabaena cylindrica PCC 7122]MBY5307293.1 DUF4351 domain-containing protein [Anabaena sp. CCAP 1446/1C]MCM2409462.1 DUF4351 domain-containing protein [Anabaena sp. CCAP 1446/1C]BAY04150.1 hypothetical protein NIES19_34120 [Anabaena cylindrica PCC 7122]
MHTDLIFLVNGIKQTRVYQEAKEEGRQEARQEWQTNLLVRQLSKRFGKLSSNYIENINKLTIEQREDLGEALLDFVDISELEQWLKTHTDK